MGSTREDAAAALAFGDIPGISEVITSGELRSMTSRNTTRATRLTRQLTKCAIGM